MYKVQFGDYNSYDDFGLTLTGLTIGVPSVKTNYVNIPARDGQIDLSNVLTNQPVYDMRTIAYVFTWKSSADTFEDEARAIVTALHGKNMQVVHNNDVYYYDGKVTVSSPSLTDIEKASINVSLYCQPFALKRTETTQTISLTSSAREITVTNNGGMSVIPTFTATASAVVAFGSTSVSMDAGTHRYANIILPSGDSTLTVSGSGSLTITYREGTL